MFHLVSHSHFDLPALIGPKLPYHVLAEPGSYQSACVNISGVWFISFCRCGVASGYDPLVGFRTSRYSYATNHIFKSL